MEKAAAAAETKAVKDTAGVEAQTARLSKESAEERHAEVEDAWPKTAVKSESRISVAEETVPVDAETKVSEERNETGTGGEVDVTAKNSGEALEEEGNVDAMDAGDKISQIKAEGKAEENKSEQFQAEEQQPVIVVVKKKLGRPKKIRDPEAVKENLKTPMSETKRPRQKEPITPLSERERPLRERKLIDRFVASVEKGKKELVIKQGTGTTLNDIPNVYFKLGKKAKGDETLSILHSVLYNKRAKASAIKTNILQFSGYVWTENEEKERTKVREKLEKYTKESLIQIVDVLDLHLSKTGKKEDIVAKVLEFLEAPHKTTDVSLQEKEQKAKERKRKRTPGRVRGRKRKLDVSSATKKRGRRKESCDEDMHCDYGNSGDESLEEEEEVERMRLTFMDEHDHEEGDDENDEDYETKQKSQKRESKLPKEGAKVPAVEKISNEEGSDVDQASKLPTARMVSSPDIARSSFKTAEKVYTKRSRKKIKENEKAPAKRGGKQKSITNEIASGKSFGRGRRGNAKEPKELPAKNTKPAEIPSDELLQNEIRKLLKDLSQEDFSRVTYMDIVVQLEDKFNTALSMKKGHVKLLIRQELSRLAEEVGDDEDEPDTPKIGAAESRLDAVLQTSGNAERQETEPLAYAKAYNATKFSADAKIATAAAGSMELKTQKDQPSATNVQATLD